MKKILSALFILALCASQATAQNAVKNPSFEDPTVSTGSSIGQWFRFGSGTQGVSSESTAEPRTGQRHIDLSMVGANQFAGVFQTLENPGLPGTPRPIKPGATVTFSGWVKSTVQPFNTTQEIKLEWSGAAQNRVDVLTLGNTYEKFTHTGVAPAGTTGLTVTYAISSFGAGQSGDSQVYLDDVSVTVVPEPASAGLLGASALGLLGAVRRRK